MDLRASESREPQVKGAQESAEGINLLNDINPGKG